RLEHERREAGALALGELRLGKAGKVVARERGEERVPGVAGLHQHLALLLAAPGAARHLRKDREQTLRRTVIGRDERRVGIQDADQSEAGEIVAFGEELRADQDIGLATLDALQRVRELSA